MVEIDRGSERLCFLVDPDGPLQWLGNDRLLGRQSFGPVKNNLVIWKAISGASATIRIPVDFIYDIDYIKVLPQGAENANPLVMVVSNKDKKFSVLDIKTRRIERCGPYGNHIILEITDRLVSPDGNKIVVRCVDDSSTPVLKVYNLIQD